MNFRTIEQALKLQIATMYTIMTNNLNMRKECAKIVLKVLRGDQKAIQITIENEFHKVFKLSLIWWIT